MATIKTAIATMKAAQISRQRRDVYPQLPRRTFHAAVIHVRVERAPLLLGDTQHQCIIKPVHQICDAIKRFIRRSQSSQPRLRMAAFFYFRNCLARVRKRVAHQPSCGGGNDDLIGGGQSLQPRR